MKREPELPADAGVLDEYDFRAGTRGKYATRYAAGTNIRLLEPDLEERFPDSQSVNDALRRLVALRGASPVDENVVNEVTGEQDQDVASWNRPKER